MATETCPVCKGATVDRGDSDHGDRRRFSCPRCGDYQITGTALAMLGGRLNGVANRYARLSHAIRRRQGKGKEWFLITSANIDELVNAPLPNIAEQLEQLVRWVAGNLGDDKLGAFPLPRPVDLAGILGTIDGTRVERLLRHAKEQGLVDLTENGEIALTPDGWEMMETVAKRVDEGQKGHNDRTVKANCNQCGGDRNAIVRASHAVPGNEGFVSWKTVMEILECGGCSEISVRRKFWFSEWENISQDPVTGKLVRDMPEKITYWPAKQTRARPKWRDRVSDDNLRQVMDEVYAAIDQGLVVLAAIGARTLLDRAMLLTGCRIGIGAAAGGPGTARRRESGVSRRSPVRIRPRRPGPRAPTIRPCRC